MQGSGNNHLGNRSIPAAMVIWAGLLLAEKDNLTENSQRKPYRDHFHFVKIWMLKCFLIW